MNISSQWQYLKSQPGFQKAPLRVLTRLALWRWLCARRQPCSVHLPVRNLRLYLPPDWHGAAKLLYIFRDDYEPDLAILEKFLAPGNTMIDIGANYGMFSLVASRKVTNTGRVLAFEPTEITFAVLKRNLDTNTSLNVIPLRIALSDSAGTTRLYHDPDATRNSLAPAAQSQDFEEVQTATLDQLLVQLNLPNVDFIKIDVEGADELVCRGAVKTLQACRPVVLFEHNALAASRMNVSARNTGKVLSDLGYEFYRPEPGDLVRADAANLPEGNILAVHPRGAKGL